jgi:membrane protease YdiL (CAAX protease family)
MGGVPMTTWFTDWVKRSPLVAYFCLVFGIEWILFFALRWGVSPMTALLIGSWLPNAMGVLVTGMADGRTGLRALLDRVVLWRIGLKWYAVALSLPVALAYVAIGLYTLCGHAAPDPAPASQLLPILLGAVFTGAMGEELGWRGTALPRLQARWNPLISSLILGVLWGLYHLPSFLLSGLPLQDMPLIPFMVAALGITILISWTFNRTAASLIPVFLYHCAFNFIGNAAGVFGIPALSWLLAGSCAVAALAVVAADWARFTGPAPCPWREKPHSQQKHMRLRA